MDTEARIAVEVTVMPRFSSMVDASTVMQVARTVVEHIGVAHAVQMGVLITDDSEIHALNARFRHVDKPTDVLSFAFREDAPGARSLRLPPGEPEPLGDVVVSYERAQAQAHDIGHSTERELAWLIVHGTLQLLGYQHETSLEEAAMRDQERAILAGLGYSPEPGDP